MRRHRHDPAVREAAVAAVRAGASRVEAAVQLGVPVPTVRGWALAAGLRDRTPARHTTATRRRAIALVEAGASYRAAAREVGTDHATVTRWCRGAPSGPPRGRVRELFRSGWRIAHLADRYSVPAARIRRWVKDLGPGRVGNPGSGRAEEVRKRLLAGERSCDIARDVDLDPSTVRRHLQNLRAQGLLRKEGEK